MTKQICTIEELTLGKSNQLNYRHYNRTQKLNRELFLYNPWIFCRDSSNGSSTSKAKAAALMAAGMRLTLDGN